MQLLGDECIEMEAVDMWEWDVTRDGRATAVQVTKNALLHQVETTTALFASTPTLPFPAPSTHRARDCSMLPRRGSFQEWVEKHRKHEVTERVY